MAAVTDEYKTLVIDNLKKYAGLSHPVKAGLAERLFVRKARVNRIYPNPEDEFSMTKIGPNYEIVGNYVKAFLDRMTHHLPPFDDPLIVEKMSAMKGYMLLNGHHRWMAANRLQVRRVPVKIVNVTHEDDILQMMERSANNRCVSIDLDEVLLENDIQGSREPRPANLAFFSKLRLREKAPDLIKELQRMGFDVWVYTGGFYTVKYLERLFKEYGFNVDGIVNGLKTGKESKRIKERFENRYECSIHIDTMGVTVVDTRKKEYEILNLDSDAKWATGVIALIRKSKCL